jgi:hypothetical protein
MQSKKWKKILLGSTLLISGLLYLSYWYMIQCKGIWYGEPVENQRNSELIEIKRSLERDIAYMQNLGPRNSVRRPMRDFSSESGSGRWQSRGSP